MTELPHRPLNEPLVFTPFFRPQVWGGQKLAELLHKPLPAGAAIGEAWELSTQALHVSRVRDRSWAGVSLQQLWDERRADLIGRDPAPQFPWLIKWLDCRELLSVQVHPDDAAALRMLGEPYGKTESWVVLHAEPTARIYAGLKPGVTRGELERRSRDGTVAECLHSFVPKPGDCLHIPAGTIHAVGGGVVLAEVQQTSDATFRLFDWNRVDAHGQPRELHLAQALEAIDFERGPVNPITPQRVDAKRELLATCPYYRLERVTFSEPWEPECGIMQAAMVLAGEVRLSTAAIRREIQTGETVLIPAAASEIRCEPIAGQTATLLWISRP